ncbi:hypothetical protein OSB04_021683 [Centaurea solstitialis]|uniref:Uncharacterized protein n=1 Tax=Centaurea solstitialis TaxID=347529 RepID=A0AA38WEE6_9ASTR|nr:hypothetical protein OSB04_021683 [Centaurea solstitialis]
MADSDSDNDDIDLVVNQIIMNTVKATEMVKELFDNNLLQDEVGETSKIPRGPRKDRGREEGHNKLVADYFAEHPVYNNVDFDRRFRLSRRLFLRIINDLDREVDFFKQQWDARGVKGFSPLQKCASAIHQLAYGSASDAFDEYLRMSETMSRECLDQFCKGIIYLYMRQYLRKPTATDVQAIYALHEQTHGLPGMLGSIDCMHWYWKNYPWHGGVNSIEVIILDRRIYPEWTTFVKAFRYPVEEPRVHFKTRQESARKDIEQTFATLKDKWHVVKYPARWKVDVAADVATGTIVDGLRALLEKDAPHFFIIIMRLNMIELKALQILTLRFQALSSAYMPIGAVLISPEVADVISSQSDKLGELSHGFTYSGHPVSCAVALETLKLYRERNIVEQVNSVAGKFQDGLKSFSSSPIIGEIRGTGLILATEFTDNKSRDTPFPPEWGIGEYFGAKCKEHGMLVRNTGDIIMMCPPLIITLDEVDELISIYAKALKATEAKVEELKSQR